ncbi:putative kinesin [Trypanosoma vivax]|nr:putative kinesin [Trypanosoma vivax]
MPEPSAVLVAVRVRPFNSRESPRDCTVCVTYPRAITLTDVGSLSNANSLAGSSPQRHVFRFDKIFWSVPNSVLPLQVTSPREDKQSLAMASDSETHSADTSSPSRTSRDGSMLLRHAHTNSLASAAGVSDAYISPPTTTTSSHFSAHALPCFMPTPKHDDQTDVYAYIGPRMYESALAGYNSCLFAYGQTGSGKTYSMIGPQEALNIRSPERGIIQRLCEDIFDMMRREREADEGITYNVECSFFEIYCERVRDLLTHSSVHGSATSTTANLANCQGSPRFGAIAKSNQGQSTSGQQQQHSANPPLRIRQHPTRGPYVDGLSLVQVRDVEGVMRQLTSGLKERATAETKMNEHSSRSHAILQLHITRISFVRDEGAVLTRTRSCKVNLVDLAGSERVTQSGATGERFEEARNINLSLTTLSRVIMQLTDRQAGKHVVPSYRDSVLTWLLSDSLGGNSKTIMLATVAPSAYCYQQTLNTLRFAGVTKKVLNVATVNEDQHFQKLIAALRQQVVRLTLQLEEGKAAEVHRDEIRILRRDRDELEARLGALQAKILAMVPEEDMQALQKRLSLCEEECTALRSAKNQLQKRYVSVTTALRDELNQKRSEIMNLHDLLSKKENEVQEWARRYKEEALKRERPSQPHQPSRQVGDHCAGSTVLHEADADGNQTRVDGSKISSVGAVAKSGHNNRGREAVASSLPSSSKVTSESAESHQQLQQNIEALTKSIKAEQRRRKEAEDRCSRLSADLDKLQKLSSDAQKELQKARQHLGEKTNALRMKEADLVTLKALLHADRNNKTAAENENSLVTQLEQMREEYLGEKQANVDLLLRVSTMEEELAQLRQEAIQQTRDISELEQLLLEETETSERYYLSQICHQKTLDIVIGLLLRPHSSSAYVYGLNGILTDNSTSAQSHTSEHSFSAPCVTDCENNNISNSNNCRQTYMIVQEAISNIMCDEACRRLMLEEEWFMFLLEMIAQRDVIKQLMWAVASEKISMLQDASKQAEEEEQRLRRKLNGMESVLENAKAAQQALQASLSRSECERERLERQVDDLSADLEQKAKHIESLVQKIADGQVTREFFDRRSDELESTNSGVGFPEDGRGEVEDVGQSKNRSNVGHSELNAQLVKQIAQYREEVGLLNAQLQREQVKKMERQRIFQREMELKQRELLHVKRESQASLKMSTQIVREYESRVRELQDVSETLRCALEEETNSADRSHELMRRAEMAKCEALNELRRVSESKEALERSCIDTEQRIGVLHQKQQQLWTEYHCLEKKLLLLQSLQGDDVGLELDFDNADRRCIERARQEKEILQKQMYEARQLSAELLAAVMKRKDSLRELEAQLSVLKHENSAHRAS